MKKLFTLLTLLLLWAGSSWGQSVIIGTGALNTNGSTIDPVEWCYNYERYQIIYLAAELPAADMIAGTTSQYYVRADCGGQFSAWAGPETFATDCDVFGFPVTENFDDTPLDQVPLCWTRETHTIDWRVATDTSTVSPPNAIATFFDADFPKDDQFFTPGLELTDSTSYDVSFYVVAPGWLGVGEKLAVKWGNSPSATGMTGGTIYENTNIQFAAYTRVQGSFTPAADGVYYIGWHAFSDADVDFIAIDNVTIITLFIWTGNFSTDWPDPGNWYRSVMPHASSSVIIPSDPESNPDRFPVIPNGVMVNCNNITVGDGATVTVQPGGTLNVINP